MSPSEKIRYLADQYLADGCEISKTGEGFRAMAAVLAEQAEQCEQERASLQVEREWLLKQTKRIEVLLARLESSP